MTEIKTPPGTVPLFYNFSLWQNEQNSRTFPMIKRHLGRHEKQEDCITTYGCHVVGFRVIDQKEFDAFMRHEVFRHKMNAVYFEHIKGQLMPLNQAR